METWGDHERVNVISKVIKSSDPEQINFFAQCLIQRYCDLKLIFTDTYSLINIHPHDFLLL